MDRPQYVRTCFRPSGGGPRRGRERQPILRTSHPATLTPTQARSCKAIVNLFGEYVAPELVAEKVEVAPAVAPVLTPSGRAPNDPREVRRRQREAERLAKEAAEADAKAAAEQPLASPEIVASEPVVEAQVEQVAEPVPADAQPEQFAEPVTTLHEQPLAEADEPAEQAQVSTAEVDEQKPEAPTTEEVVQPSPQESEQAAEGDQPDNREKPQG